MKKIGILGGSFDPIHNGHLELATKALIENNLNYVFFLPAKHNPFKINQEITKDYDRVNMIKSAIVNKEYFCILENELKVDRISYTYDTMNEIIRDFQDSKLYFILGADSFMSLESWYKGDELLQMISFIVSVRPGYNEKELHNKIDWYKESYGTEIILINDSMPNISSTVIRNRIGNGQSISDLVPEEVERYITDNGLYLRNN